MLSVIMLSVIMLSVIMLSVIMWNAIMLSVMVLFQKAHRVQCFKAFLCYLLHRVYSLEL